MDSNELDKYLIRIPLDRDALARMPDDIRSAILLLAHIGNELNTFSQLAAYTMRPHGHPVLDRLGKIHGWSVLRVFVGKIIEAGEVFRDVVFKPPTRERLICHIRSEAAWERVRRLIGKKGALRIARSTHAFHYPKPEVFNAAFAATQESEDLSLCAARARVSSFYNFADTISVKALAESIAGELGGNVERDHLQIVDSLGHEAVQTANAMQNLIEDIVAGVLQEFGALRPAERLMPMDDPRIADWRTYKMPPLARGIREDDS